MKKNYKYVIISPYFGKLPTSFNLWLESCSYNKNFNFIIFTDNFISNDIPDNVNIIHISFKNFCKKIQSKFNFNISLENPYKLCDFRPAYGYIFSDYIKDCEYWGYCDFDLIFGNLDKFMPKEKYDKISDQGHFSLYRNLDKIQEAFKKKNTGTIDYVDIFSHNQNFAFDEIGEYGINRIFEKEGYTIYNFRNAVADVDCRKRRMYRRDTYLPKSERGNQLTSYSREKIFIFNEGRVYSYGLADKIIDGEYAYVHFQKRKMINNVKNKKKFLITYNGFMDYPSKDTDLQCFSPKNNLDFTWINIKMKTTPKRIKREFAIMRLKNKRRH